LFDYQTTTYYITIGLHWQSSLVITTRNC